MNKFMPFVIGLALLLLVNPMVLADDVNTSVEVQQEEEPPLGLSSLGITIFLFALALAGVRVLFDIMYTDFTNVSDLVGLGFHFAISFAFIAMVIIMVFGG